MINLSILQIVIAIISVLYILNSTSRFIRREKSSSILKFLATFLIWTIIFLIAVFPEFFKTELRYLGFGENFNFIIFAGFIIVFVLIFRLLTIIEHLEKNITEIVRKEALRSLPKKK